MQIALAQQLHLMGMDRDPHYPIAVDRANPSLGTPGTDNIYLNAHSSRKEYTNSVRFYFETT
jgi:hypothetical protein